MAGVIVRALSGLYTKPFKDGSGPPLPFFSRPCALSKLGIEIRSVDTVLLVEQVFDQPVDLDVISDVVRRVQIDLRIATERLVDVRLITIEDLVARCDQVCAENPFWCEFIIESRFEAVAEEFPGMRSPGRIVMHKGISSSSSSVFGDWARGIDLGLFSDGMMLVDWKVAST